MTTPWTLDANFDFLIFVVRLLAATLCGFFIGYERKARSKEAGIRTHSIVCMATALIMILSKYAFGDRSVGDAGRLAAQVVSGIGFLGAGIIIYRREILHGLTTAAGLWATAGIGMAFGSGMLLTGLFSTVLLITLQIIFHRPIKALRGKIFYTIKLTCTIDDPKIVDQILYLFEAKKFLKFKLVQNAEQEVNADIELVTERLFTAKEMLEIAAMNPFIKTAEKTDEL